MGFGFDVCRLIAGPSAFAQSGSTEPRDPSGRSAGSVRERGLGWRGMPAIYRTHRFGASAEPHPYSARFYAEISLVWVSDLETTNGE